MVRLNTVKGTHQRTCSFLLCDSLIRELKKSSKDKPSSLIHRSSCFDSCTYHNPFFTLSQSDCCKIFANCWEKKRTFTWAYKVFNDLDPAYFSDVILCFFPLLLHCAAYGLCAFNIPNSQMPQGQASANKGQPLIP